MSPLLHSRFTPQPGEPLGKIHEEPSHGAGECVKFRGQFNSWLAFRSIVPTLSLANDSKSGRPNTPYEAYAATPVFTVRDPNRVILLALKPQVVISVGQVEQGLMHHGMRGALIFGIT